MAHLDSILRQLHPDRALLCDGDGRIDSIVPWTEKRRGGKPQPFLKPLAKCNDPGPWGRWIRANRVDMGMTQAQLAKRVRMTKAAVSAWETGKDLPGEGARKRLDELFGEGPWNEPLPEADRLPPAPFAIRPAEDDDDD